MKKIIIDVRCINSGFTDAPEHVLINLNDEQISRIRNLTSLVSEHELNSVDYLDSRMCFFSSSTLEELDESIGMASITAKVLEDKDNFICDVELCKFVVYKDFFTVSCIPKHCGESERCTSDRLSIDLLNANEDYCVATY